MNHNHEKTKIETSQDFARECDVVRSVIAHYREQASPAKAAIAALRRQKKALHTILVTQKVPVEELADQYQKHGGKLDKEQFISLFAASTAGINKMPKQKENGRAPKGGRKVAAPSSDAHSGSLFGDQDANGET